MWLVWSKKIFFVFLPKPQILLNKTLVLYAHPYHEHSQTNVRLIEAYKNLDNITFRDLYEEYPDFHIQAFKERKALKNYSTIIFHMPLIWFGMPPLLKLWIDEVFDFRWIANENIDNPLCGKDAYIVVSTGGTAHAYSDEGIYKYNLNTYMTTLKECIRINNMNLKEMMVVYNADNLSEFELEQHLQKLKNISQQLCTKESSKPY